jgi:hypothetical protein
MAPDPELLQPQVMPQAPPAGSGPVP